MLLGTLILMDLERSGDLEFAGLLSINIIVSWQKRVVLSAKTYRGSNYRFAISLSFLPNFHFDYQILDQNPMSSTRKSPESNIKTKFTYNGPSRPLVGQHKDLEKINKILENAKKYEKEKDTKRDYMMEELNNINRKLNTEHQESQSKLRIASKEGKNSRRDNIYRKVDDRDREISSNSSRHSRSQKNLQVSPRNLVTITSGEVQKKVMLSPSLPHENFSQIADRNSQNSAATPRHNSNSISSVHGLSQAQHRFYDTQMYSSVDSGQYQFSQNYKPQLPHYELRDQTFINSTKDVPYGFGARQMKESHTNALLPSVNEVSSVYKPDGSSANGNHNPRQTENKRDLKEEKIILESKSVRGDERAGGQVQQREKKIVCESSSGGADLKSHLERVIFQSEELRQKYYRSEQQKNNLQQKNRVLQKEKSQLRNESEDLKFKNKFLEAELSKIKASEKNLQAQVQDKTTASERNYQQMVSSISSLNAEVKNKTIFIQNIEREQTLLRDTIQDQGRQIERLKQMLRLKEDELSRQFSSQQNSGEGKAALQLNLRKERAARMELEEEVFNLRRQKVQQAKLDSELRKAQNQIERLRSALKDADQERKEKTQLLRNISQDRGDRRDFERLRDLEEELKAVCMQKVQLELDYEKRLLEKEKQIQFLDKKCNDRASEKKLNYPEAEQESFEKVMREQLETINALKQENTNKTNQFYQLKSEHQSLRAQLHNSFNQNKLMGAQIAAIKQNESQSTDAKARVQASELSSLNRRVSQLSEQLERKKQEVKDKDAFIQSYLVNVSRKEDVPLVLAQLEKLLPGGDRS